MAKVHLSVDPMVPFMTGWLMNAIHHEGNDVFNLKSVIPKSTTNGFIIELKSGQKFEVNIIELKKEKTQ